MCARVETFRSFSHVGKSSITVIPHGMELGTLRGVRRTGSDLIGCGCLTVALGACLVASRLSSTRVMVRRVRTFVRERRDSSRVTSLRSRYFGVGKGVFTHIKGVSSTRVYFQGTCRLQVEKAEVRIIPSVLVGLTSTGGHLKGLSVKTT